MNQRIAVVTGGTGTIGTEICRSLAAEGWTVAAIGHPSEADRIEQWVEQAGFPVKAWLAELSDFAATGETLAAIQSAMGPIEALVNAAGITRDAPLKRMDADDWQAVIDANLSSVFNTCRKVIPNMIAAENGRIVNISSVNGQKGQFGQTNYSAAKAGMHGFTMALAQEVARHGITVNTVSPGYIDSPMIRAVPEPVRERILAGIPAGRFGRPEEIAEVVAFLCRPTTAYINGANIPVNGAQFTH
ncbi:MAG: acetoacetyl-CoA reductase [Abyssibacter sp.]|uniref:acetoacetyl-CoA reductase n=1 Tax=Abyssibacter sp. TaxID=2320200 RepID=UPI002EB1BF17|nr:acetoacetyl-CoA reductase [Pseudomonadota bacterium]